MRVYKYPWERPICVDQARSLSLGWRLLSTLPYRRSHDIGSEHTMNYERAEYCCADLSNHNESSISLSGASTYQRYDDHVWIVVSKMLARCHKLGLTVIPTQSPVGHHRPRENSRSDNDRRSNEQNDIARYQIRSTVQRVIEIRCCARRR